MPPEPTNGSQSSTRAGALDRPQRAALLSELDFTSSTRIKDDVHAEPCSYPRLAPEAVLPE